MSSSLEMPGDGVVQADIAAQSGTDQFDVMARNIFLSYRFSQGGIGLQNRILGYLRDNFFPTLFDDETIVELHKRTHDLVRPYFLNDTTHPQTAIPWDYEGEDEFQKTVTLVDNELIGLFERVRNPAEMLPFESTPLAIGRGIIFMDADYASRPGGRAGSSDWMKVRTAPYKRDPYGSVFIDNAVLGHTTRSDFFDKMLAEAGKLELLANQDKETLFQLLNLVQVYMRYHVTVDPVVYDLRDAARKAYDGQR